MKTFLPHILCCLLSTAAASFAQMPAGPVGAPATASAATARTPQPWLQSAVIYEIFPRSFSPAGNLNGVTAKLDQLQQLGVNVLWLMPLHPVGQLQKKGPQGSPYAVRDYYAIDPGYGTKDDLHRLIDEAHRRHMRVIIDIVANHTAFDSVMMSHPDFYKHDAQGKILSPYDWTDVAALDYTNPKLRRYMIDMLLYWAKDFNLDGFRCDAAGEVPTDFWESARRELDHLHPGILMLAEASKPELLRSAFDLDYSWPMMAALNDILQHGQSASSLRTTLAQEAAAFPKQSVHMRMFDDHDEQRALGRYGAAGSLAAAALIFTLDGVPMIYNGMEVSDTTESGAPALFENLKIWWQAGEMRPEFPRYYDFLIALRAHEAALRQGATVWIHNSDEAHVVSYIRRTNEDEMLVAVNLSGTPFRGTLEAAGAWDEVVAPATRQRPNTNEAAPPEASVPAPALPALSLNSFGVRIFHRSLHGAAQPAPSH
ncbi:maltogenic amylase [Granulicella rosea]|uniref:Maltogenic amylase n=1 Tax=Granulicella rosea TaxID=474952 RepID=A0A239MLD5_9BACT|nr:alpha-amylase family glycosyl hydrolase [Granulicella rosea]SNT42778.1 maltogenic amylase [Granulicella rosea]